MGTTAGFGCSGDQIECEAPNTLEVGEDGVSRCAAPKDIECPDGTAADTSALGVLICVPNGCTGVTCDAVPAGLTDYIASMKLSADGCSCEAATCKDGFELSNGMCYPDCEAQFGCAYEQAGFACVVNADHDCRECESPICTQVPCQGDNDPLAAIENPPGRPLCIQAPPPPEESCEGCHGAIEDPHPWFGGPELTCTGCHGGDAEATTQTTAHVLPPAQWRVGATSPSRSNLRYYFNWLTLFGVENFEGGNEWLRFRNPSDIRVADQSCGKNSGCHQDRVENVRRSVMATEVGLTGGALARDSVPRSIRRGEAAIYSYDVTEAMTLGENELEAVVYNPDFIGSLQRVDQFEITNRDNFGEYDQIDILREVYDKQCGDCHLGNAGANNRYADFRTSGCGSCHMNYRLDGISESADPLIKKNEPTYPNAFAQIANFDANDLANLNQAWLGSERPHPRKHRLTRQMVSQKCGTCHVGSNRTDWQYRGYRFDPNRDAVLALDNARLNADQIVFTDEIDNNANAFARYHGAAQDQILKYEDWNDDGLDDSPADIHFLAGLECMDCHTSDEMHNELKFPKVAQVTDWEDETQVTDMSGALWARQDMATEIECVHCHGNLEYRALPHVADNRNPIKNLIVCPEQGEVIDNYTPPPECDDRTGRYLRSKFTGRLHYVSQTYDTVAQVGGGAGGATRDNGAPVYTLQASIAHGRFNDNFADGVGPCADGNPAACYKDQANNAQQVTQGFSHLGKTAVNSVDQHAGGLECYACHATWVNGCFGCHLTLQDFNGATQRDFARSTGEYTLGVIAQADFTYIDPLAVQLGINSEGKISQHLPETKQAVRHIYELDGNAEDFFGTKVIVNNDANLVYNIYRNRAGYGTRQYATEQVGLALNADGNLYEQNAQMDENAGQGFNQMMPHSVQRSHPLMDCNTCHNDLNDANTAAVDARWGINPDGFANVSAYLIALDNLAIVRNNTNQEVTVDQNAGFRLDANIDPDGFVVDMQTDWCAIEGTGFPLCYTNHPIKGGAFQQEGQLQVDANYIRQYPTNANVAGPINLPLIQRLDQVRVDNAGLQFKGIR